MPHRIKFPLEQITLYPPENSLYDFSRDASTTWIARKLLSREVHCDSGRVGERGPGLSVVQVISGGRRACRKFRSRRERISIAIEKAKRHSRTHARHRRCRYCFDIHCRRIVE